MTRSMLDEAVELHRQGDLAHAEKLYRQVLADASHMLGVLKAQQGENKVAHDLIAPVIAADPRNVLALENFANVLRALHRCEEALKHFDAVLALAPGNPSAWFNRANTLDDLGRLSEALSSYERALLLKPDFALALNNRGTTLMKLGCYQPALDSFEKALAVDARYSAAHINRGDALQRLCKYQESLASYERALALDPANPDTWCNRGVALEQLGQLEAARQSFAHAEKLVPGMPEARLNLGRLCLLQEDFKRGWPLFEARKTMPEPWDARSYAQPLWTGAEAIKGKTLFVHIHCGLGDAIQFYRYAALAQARGAHVILSANRSLLPLLRNAIPEVVVIGAERVPDRFDYHIPLMSMPLALGVDIPETGRYLTADPARVRDWRGRLGDRGFRVAIAWQGGTAKGAEGKSFPVSALSRIAAMPGLRLISLQKNKGVEQLQHLPQGMMVENFASLDDGPGAFLDSAAILENCELLISCDTSLAHLAGALGISSWIALKYVPDWRWFLKRNDTPWYPNTRLFRQKAPGDWGTVFCEMEAELASIIRALKSRF